MTVSVTLPASLASKVKMWQVRGEVASSVCSEKVTLGPSSVPVWLWRRAVPVTLSVVALLTNTGSSAGVLPGVKSNWLPDAVVTVNCASWK